MAITPEHFKKPEKKYRVNPMTHGWSENRALSMQALNDYGYGGVVTNVRHDKGFTGNPDNIEEFKKIISELEDAGLGFWIYDEYGYPSGYAHGETLKGHPELEAKGFYMVRRIAYEPRRTTFRLDEESDKIVWAAKYPLDTPGMHESFIVTDKMEPVPFTEDSVVCDMNAYEALFIFCVKPAYEGSHCTHNVCSFSRYINVMDERAVRRFIDLCFEPIAAAIPDAFRRAAAVFTDEPSLQVGYARGYESWPYALTPWVDGLFGEFEQEYGFSMLPYLPFLFEGRAEDAYAIRVKFYRLVGKLIARAFSGQLSAWCEAHGGKFSGHYLGEESMVSNVKDYGSIVEVMKAASYPGIDVLTCIPETYNYNSAKHVQMVVRKKGTNGMMVEICPFDRREEFAKDPIENMTGVMGLLYQSGVRVTHSYFSSDYSEYSPEFANAKGYMKQDDTNRFNEYVGRLGYMLDGVMNDCNTFIYYGIEDTQAKMKPAHSSLSGPECEADFNTYPLAVRIYESGHDFYYADRDDICDAAKSAEGGLPVISGCAVKTVIVPPLDVVYDETLESLAVLQKAGVTILFAGKLPRFGTETESRTQELVAPFRSVTTDDILTHLSGRGDAFHAKADGVTLIQGKYLKDGQEIYYLVNKSRAAADVQLDHAEKQEAMLYNPVNGEITPVKMGESVQIPSLRSAFIVFD